MKWVDNLPQFLAAEDLVEQAKSSFQQWAVTIILSNLIIWQPWLGSPVIRQVLEMLLNLFLKILIDKGELGAFIINTKVLTSAQASEYRNAIADVIKAKTDEESEKAERIANEKFDNLIKFNS